MPCNIITGVKTAQLQVPPTLRGEAAAYKDGGRPRSYRVQIRRGDSDPSEKEYQKLRVIF